MDSSIFNILFSLGMGGSAIFLFLGGMVGLALLVFAVLLIIESYKSIKIQKEHHITKH